jgi:hypothetical protein
MAYATVGTGPTAGRVSVWEDGTSAIKGSSDLTWDAGSNKLFLRGLLSMQDPTGANFPAGVAMEYYSQMINMGINDDSTGRFGSYNYNYQGGFFRVDARDDYPLFSWYGRGKGSTSTVTQLATLTTGGNLALGGTLSVTGAATLSSTLTVSSTLKTTDTTDATSTTTGALQTAGGFGCAKKAYFGAQVYGESSLTLRAGAAGNSTHVLTYTSTDTALYALYTGGVAKVLLHTAGASYFLGGNLGINTSAPTISDGVGLHIDGKIIRMSTSKTPASAGATGNAGEICWDSSYVYVCVATNTWKRAAISTW